MSVRPFVHVLRSFIVAALVLSPLAQRAALAVPATAAKPSPTPGPTATASPPATKFVQKPYTKAVGAFYLTMPDGTKLPLSALTYDAKESLSVSSVTGAGAGRAAETVSLTVPDADAVKLLETQFAGKVESQLTVTAPNTTIGFTSAKFGNATIAGSGSTFTIAFDKVALTTTAPTILDTQTAMKPGLAKPSLQLGNQGFALTSETFSTKAKVSSGTAADATFVFKPGDAVSLLGALGKVFANASLATADATYAFTSPAIAEAAAVFDASGTPTITADVVVKGYTLTAGTGPSAPVGRLFAALPKAGGTANVPLTGLTLHLANAVSGGTGAASGPSAALRGQFTIADAPSVALAQSDFQSGVHDVVITARAASFTLKNLKFAGLTQASTGGGRTTFAFSFTGLETTTSPSGSTLGEAGDRATASTSQTQTPSITIAGKRYSLVSETVSSQKVTSPTAGAGAGRSGTASTTDIVFANPGPLKLYLDAVTGASLDTVDLATSAGDYKLTKTTFKSIDAAVDANGTPTVDATLQYESLAFAPAAGTGTANASTFYGTFTAQKPLKTPVIPLGAGTFEIAQPDVTNTAGAVGKETLTASLSVPTAVAGELIAAGTNATTFSTIVVTTPSGRLTLKEAQLSAATSSSGTPAGGVPALTTFVVRFASVAIPNGTPPNSGAVPRLAIGETTAYALASETFSSLAAGHTTSSAMSAAVVVNDATALPLFGSALTGAAIPKADLVTSALSIALTDGRFTDTKLVFGSDGQGTTNATLAFRSAVVKTP